MTIHFEGESVFLDLRLDIKAHRRSLGFAPTAGRGRRDDKGRVALSMGVGEGLGELRSKSGGIPHLAKNERDVGHPVFVGDAGSGGSVLLVLEGWGLGDGGSVGSRL
jgi:hypothetical protein